MPWRPHSSAAASGVNPPERASASASRKNPSCPAGVPIPGQAGTLGALLRAPYERLTERLYGGLEQAGFRGVRPAHSAVIRHLPEAGARLTELAARAGITKQNMAYLVGHLEECGYLRVTRDRRDARARLVRFTPKGLRLAAALVAGSRALKEEAAARLGERTMQELRERLATLDELWRE